MPKIGYTPPPTDVSGLPATYAALATVDAKGDLLAGTADNTLGRLAAGVNGRVLLADSAQSVGLRWGTSSELVAAALGWLIVTDPTYGADPTGTADSTSALQAALDAATARSFGGTVWLPAGSYLLNSALTIGSNTTLIGAGALSTLNPVYAAANHAAVITNDLVNGNSKIALRDFRLDRSGSNVQHGILLNGVDGLLVSGVEIVGFPSVVSGALAISGVLPGGSPASRLLSKNVRVTGCYFAQTNNFGVQVSYVTNCAIVGNVFEDCYREVIGVEPETSCTATNVTVTGNDITTGTIPSGGSATGCIVVTTSSGGSLDGVSVVGNTIKNMTATVSNANPGISVLGNSTASRVTVIGNVIRGMNGNGISVGNASIATFGVIVTGNVITDCNLGQNTTFGGAGISLRQAGQCIVTANWINGTPSNRHTASIYESQSGTQRNMIANNVMLDSAGAVTLLAGSNSVVQANITRNSGGARTGTASSATMTVDDTLVAVTDTSAARTITLPSVTAVSVGRVFTIVDESNAAGTNNITVQRAGADTFLGGGTTKTINTNGGALRLYSNGTVWVPA